METAAVAELKSHLSHYLRQVKGGREVVVTERGRPIARLVPIAFADDRSASREDLVATGLLKPGRSRLRKALLQPPEGEPVSGVVEALLAERAEGR